MKKLYLFDFDGTLTYKDTMFLFLKYYDSKKYFWSYFKHIPVFILVKLKLMDAELAKKSFDEYYPKIIRESALDFFKNIDKNNTTFYLVSASLDIWVRPFAKKMGMTLIATEAQFVEGRFTGNFQTKNNNGEEKVKRIKQVIGDQKFDKIIAFGDTSGDKPMLAFAHESHYRFFN